MRSEAENRTARLAFCVVILSCCSAWFCAQLFQSFWPQTHDWTAYPIRAVEYVQGWRSGYIFPRWAPDLYGGYGAPLFNYYAPGLFMISGLFMLAGSSATFALKLTILALTAISAIGMFLLLIERTDRLDASLLGAVIFLFMPYHATLVYVRGDFAEYGAQALLPLSLWLYSRVDRANKPRAVLLVSAAFTHAAILVTHTLTGQWYTEFLVFIIGYRVVRAWKDRRFGSAASMTIAFVGAGALSAFYTIPALLERDLVHIDRMTEGGLELIKNAVSLEWLTRPGFFYVGLAVLLSWVAIPILAASRKHRALRARALPWTLGSIALALSMGPTIVPLWSYIPLSKYVQFPWRMLGFIAAFSAIAVAETWAEVVPKKRWTTGLLVAICALTVADDLREFPHPPVMTPDQIQSTPQEIAKGLYSTVISDEYLPKEVNRVPSKPRRLFAFGGAGVGIVNQYKSGAGYKIDAEAWEKGQLFVETFWYPGWTAKSDRGPLVIHPSETGRIAIDLPERGGYKVRVQFGLTKLRAAASATSLLSLLFLFLTPLFWRRIVSTSEK